MSTFKNIFLSICVIVFIVCVFAFIYCSYRLVKTNNTHKQRMRILKAIFAYQKSRLNVGDTNFAVDYSDMELYDETDDRLWDWSYKRILPPEKFEIIKPFIK